MGKKRAAVGFAEVGLPIAEVRFVMTVTSASFPGVQYFVEITAASQSHCLLSQFPSPTSPSPVGVPDLAWHGLITLQINIPPWDDRKLFLLSKDEYQIAL